jgi:hypothetical protein
MKKISLLIAISLLVNISAIAQVDTAWVRTFGDDGAMGLNIAVDTIGNVYVNGYRDNFNGGMTAAYDPLGNMLWSRFFSQFYSYTTAGTGMVLNDRGDLYIIGPIAPDNLPRYEIIRCSTQGDSFWTRLYQGPVNNYASPSALTIDTLGNVYVTGTSDGPSWATLKYDREGNLLWTALYTGYPDLSPVSVDEIALDRSGNVVIAGTSRSRFGDYLCKACVIKYDISGNQIWATSYDSIEYLNPVHMAIDNSSNIIICALNSRQDTSGHRPVTIKLLPNGDTAWSRTYWAAWSPEGIGYNIAVDSSGYSYVTGPSFASYSDTNYYDLVVIKYAPNGDTSWVRTYDSGYEEVPVDIAIGRSGAVYIIGNVWSNRYFSDFLISKFASNGNLDWTTRYDGANGGDDYLHALAIDKWENIFVTGRSDNRFTTVKFVQSETGVEDNKTSLPGESMLLTSYPNPFNAQTTIRYTLPAASDITLDVFDITGRKIETLVSGHQEAGEHQVVWNAEGKPSGVYFYRIKTAEIVKTERCVLLK